MTRKARQYKRRRTLERRIARLAWRDYSNCRGFAWWLTVHGNGE